MKKLLLLLLLPVMLLAGCGEIPASPDYTVEENNRFVYVRGYKIDNTIVFEIFADKETKVMYLCYIDYVDNGKVYSGLTVMLNPDGTPMLWQGEL